MSLSFPVDTLKKPVLIFGLGLVLVLAFILWGHNRRNAKLGDLDSLQRRIQFSHAGPVSPSPAAHAALKEAIQSLNEVHAKLDAQLFADVARNVPDFSGNSTAAYFELAGFVEEMAQRFVKAGVNMGEGLRFGFSQFEQQGPEPGILEAVMRQKLAATVLLEPLIQARPIALTSLKREYLVVKREEPTLLQQAAGSRQTPRVEYPDALVGDEGRPGFESFTFELVFEGYTESLRLYLKSLLSAPLPVVVTGLVVQPLDRFESIDEVDAETRNPFDLLIEDGDPAVEEGPIPIIRNNLSSFSLRLEVYTGKETTPGV
ncbi:MAG: Amuc_1100 family pilus-like protein [Verrucomicrobia bacterium]|nr:Amuc_1100 family pilus-like protein [Verrucomicrobiota bacterium]MDA1065161.1 Amuc_1100 family pilus-like protein [Verrucomicrobiota bacterium]